MNYIAQRKEAFSKVPKPSWKRAKLPENLFELASDTTTITLGVEGEESLLVPFDTWLGSDAFKAEYLVETTANKHLGDAFLDFNIGHASHQYVIETNPRSRETQKVKLSFNHQGTLVDQYVIIAHEGTKLDVVIDYKTDKALANNQHYGLTRVIAKRGSHVRLFKIQQLDASDNQFEQIFAHSEEGANVEVLNVELGAGFKAVAFEGNLNGRHSRAELKSLYYGEKDQQLDLSYTMNHKGPQSESIILSKGALDDSAKKVFRGNLFFETGAKQSVGKEEEFVILLDKGVKSDSIPALMCSEDDVIGEHAASVGQLDGEKLFYLMSRGFSELEAKKMVIKASFEEVLMTLEDKALKTEIEQALERRLI